MQTFKWADYRHSKAAELTKEIRIKTSTTTTRSSDSALIDGASDQFGDDNDTSTGSAKGAISEESTLRYKKSNSQSGRATDFEHLRDGHNGGRGWVSWILGGWGRGRGRGEEEKLWINPRSISIDNVYNKGVLGNVIEVVFPLSSRHRLKEGVSKRLKNKRKKRQ